MYVTDLEVTDLRSFSGTQSLSLDRGTGVFAGWTVFAGRNGAGKSTLLKALATSIVGPLAARSLAGTFQSWVREGSPVARVATRLAFDTVRDQFQGSGRPPGDGRIWTGLEWKPTAKGADAVERWLAHDPSPKKSAATRGPWADAPTGWFVCGYGPYRHLGPVTAEIARISGDPLLARLINLFNEGATLSEAVDWLKQTHLRSLEQKEGAAELLASVLRLLGDGLLPDGSAVKRVDSDGLWIERDGMTFPLEQVSDGYRAVTALVVDLVRRLQATYGSLALTEVDGRLVCPLPGVVLIDEVDAHMHVSWQQRIGAWLTEHFPQLQFLVTTHSPFICQAASTRGIIRLAAPGEKRPMEHVEGRLFNAIVNGGADDAVMSELFGLEHAHSPEAEKLRSRIAALEFKLLNGTASVSEKEEHAKISAQLPDDLGELADRKLRALEDGVAR